MLDFLPVSDRMAFIKEPEEKVQSKQASQAGRRAGRGPEGRTPQYYGTSTWGGGPPDPWTREVLLEALEQVLYFPPSPAARASQGPPLKNLGTGMGPFAPHRGTCHLPPHQIPAWVVVRQRGENREMGFMLNFPIWAVTLAAPLAPNVD